MSIIRWDPFRQTTTLSDAVNQLMQEAVLRPGFTFKNSDALMNVVEQADRYVIRVSLPGVKAEDVEITTEQSTIQIKATRKDPLFEYENAEKSKQGVLLAEFGEATFSRSVTLPKSFSSDRFEATFDRGILTIIAPIAPEAQPRRIAVVEGPAAAR